MSALTPKEMEEFKMLEKEEAHARKIERQRKWREQKKAERLAKEEALLVKRRAAAEKARQALAEIRAGKRVSQRARARAERLKARREEAVKKAAAKVREAKEEVYPKPLDPVPSVYNTVVALPRWSLSNGSVHIDLGSAEKYLVVMADGQIVVNLNLTHP